LYSSTTETDDDQIEVMDNDRVWRAPVRELSDTYRKAGGTVYSYEFGFSSPVRGGTLGAAHAMEIPFVFANLGQPGVNEFAGDELSLGAEADTISTAMSDAWCAFAKSAVPWTAMNSTSSATSSATSTRDDEQMFFSKASSLRRDPHAEKLAWWLGHKDSFVAGFLF
jgi:para-nitrobenzyl esterase